jgi:hypothetical protein
MKEEVDAKVKKVKKSKEGKEGKVARVGKDEKVKKVKEDVARDVDGIDAVEAETSTVGKTGKEKKRASLAGKSVDGAGESQSRGSARVEDSGKKVSRKQAGVKRARSTGDGEEVPKRGRASSVDRADVARAVRRGGSVDEPEDVAEGGTVDAGSSKSVVKRRMTYGDAADAVEAVVGAAGGGGRVRPSRE